MFSKLFYSRLKTFPEQIINSRKLDTAYRLSQITDFQTKLNEPILSQNHRLMLLHLTKDELINSKIEPTLFSQFYLNIADYSNESRFYSNRENDVNLKATKLATENIKLQHYWNLNSSKLYNHMLNDDIFNNWITQIGRTNALESNLMYLEHAFGLLVERSGSLEHLLRSKQNRENLETLKKETTHYIPELKLHVYWCKNICVMNYDKTNYIMPKIYIQGIHNKICDILSSIQLLKSLSGVCYETSSLSDTRDLLSHLANLSIMYESNYFSIIKCLEAIIIGETLLVEEQWVNSSLINSINDDLIENSKYYYYGSKLEDIIKNLSTPLKQEFGSFAKIFGHPFVDIEGSCDATYNRATEEKILNPVAIQETVMISIESYLRNYILKHKKWPETAIGDQAHKGLKRARELNIDPKSPKIKREFGDITTLDYIFIELTKTFEVNKLDHYCEYLKDKTISMLKSPVIQKYFSDDNYKHKHKWTDTRLLLVYLLYSEEDADLNGYLDAYIKNSSDLDECLNMLVIKLVPKEKELKSKGRLFGCKTYQDRYRSKVQEENIGNFMDKYVFDQSMTLDHLSLIKRLHAFRDLKNAYKGWRVLYVNFDVSGWNTNFRHQTVQPILDATMNKLYGTKLFGDIHKSYEKGFFYLPDATGNYSWVGQGGGIEGLNQYSWMLTYIPQMQYALRKFNLHLFVMAYGDDYKGALIIPPAQKEVDIRVLKDEIIKSVTDTAITSFGQQIKYFDSYGSECFISFCKSGSVHDVEMPQGLRKIQKAYGANNAFLPTLDEYIASAFSNAHSAAKGLPCHYGPYFVALYWAYSHLLTNHLYEGVHDNVLHSLLLIPSVLGGLPIIHLHNFSTRSESDHLSSTIDLVTYCKTYDPLLFEVLVRGFNFDRPLDLTLEGLLQDPYSLPIDKPPLPSSVLRNTIMPLLKPIIKNEEFLELLEAAEDPWSKRFIKCLTSSDILQPRLLSSIYSCLPIAIIDEFTRRFENSASVKDLLIIKSGVRNTKRILRTVIASEIKLQEWRRNRFESDFIVLDVHWIPTVPYCPTSMANQIRRLWGKEIRGITMPPIQHLITLVEPTSINNGRHELLNHFTYHFHRPIQKLKHETSDHWKIGNAKPFLGFKTRLGADLPKVKIIDSNALLLKLQTLLDCVTWSNVSKIINGHLVTSNLPDAIKILISQYFTDDPELLMPFRALKKSGTVMHHWRSPHFKEHIMPNSLSNTYTHWRGEVDTHTSLRGSPDHYTINFLQILCHVISLLSNILNFHFKYKGGISRVWAVTTSCVPCMTPIQEPPVVLDLGPIEAGHSRVLKMTRIDRISQDVLQSSLSVYASKRFKPTSNIDDISIEIAALGVAQKFIEQSTSDSQRIRERFEAGPLSSTNETLINFWGAGQEAILVRETEVRHIPPRVMLESLCLYIYQFLITKFRGNMNLSIESYLAHEHPQAFPWIRMLELINKAGMLGHLVREAKLLTSITPPASYDNPSTSARYLGNCALTILENGLINPKIVYLSYYEEEDISKTFKSMSYVLKQRLLRKCFWRQLVPVVYKPHMVKEFEMLLCIMHTICLSEDILTECILDDIEARDAGQVEFDIELIELERVTHDAFDIALEDPHSLLCRTIRQCRKHYSNACYDILYRTYIENIETSIDIIHLHNISDLNCTLYRGVLANCITTIRESESYLEKLRVDKIPLHMHTRVMTSLPKGVIPMIKSDLSNINMPQEDLLMIESETLIYDREDIMLSSHPVWRSFSDGTSSMGKIIEIFLIMGLYIDGIIDLNIACLGEGYGGILNYFAGITNNCHFLYNSIPPSDNSLCNPELALTNLMINDHTLDNTLMASGVYDLSEGTTIRYLEENDELLYHLVTCDAELAWTDLVKYDNLIIGVIHFWLKKSTLTSVLILKVMMEATNTMVRACSLLSQYAKVVHVNRLESSPPGGEVYITAIGTKGVYPFVTVDDITIKRSPVIHRRIIGMTMQMIRVNNRRLPPNDIIVQLVKIPGGRYRDQLKPLFTASYRQLLSGRHNIILEWDKYKHVTVNVLMDRILGVLDQLILPIIGDIRNLGKRIRNIVWDDNTHATTLRLSEKYLLYVSAHKHLSEIMKQEKREIIQSEIRQAFIDACGTLPYRTGLSNPDESYFNKKILIYNQECMPFYYWMEGVKIALSAFGYHII